MRLQIITLLCCSTILLNAQNEDTACIFNPIRVSEGKYKITIQDYDSVSRSESCFMSWLNNGKGKPDGELLIYDEKGLKRRLAIYKGGIRTGKHMEWYPGGELYAETNWETDIYFNSRIYYPSGKLKHSAVNGNRSNSVYTDYFENGQVQRVNSTHPPIDKTFYDDGKLKSERSTTTRTYTEWHRNGKVSVSGAVDASAWRRIGKWSYFDPTGKLIRDLFYNADNISWYGEERGYYKEVKY